MKSLDTPTLQEVALVDAKTAAATGKVSVSWWFERVRTKDAPQPKIRAPRFTRWLATDVAQFWASLAAKSTDPARSATAALAATNARNASAAARKPSAVAKAAAVRKARSVARQTSKPGA